MKPVLPAEWTAWNYHFEKSANDQTMESAVCRSYLTVASRLPDDILSIIDSYRVIDFITITVTGNDQKSVSFITPRLPFTFCPEFPTTTTTTTTTTSTAAAAAVEQVAAAAPPPPPPAITKTKSESEDMFGSDDPSVLPGGSGSARTGASAVLIFPDVTAAVVADVNHGRKEYQVKIDQPLGANLGAYKELVRYAIHNCNAISMWTHTHFLSVIFCFIRSLYRHSNQRNCSVLFCSVLVID